MTVAESLLFTFIYSIASEALYTIVTRNYLLIFLQLQCCKGKLSNFQELQSLQRDEKYIGKDVNKAEYQIHENKQQKGL